MIGKTLFGYDIFISYSRRDSVDYALQLAQMLIEKGYTCYLDQLSSNTPGQELPVPIKHSLRRCTAFVIIGSEGAKKSEAITEEVKTFLSQNKQQPVIPVNVNGAIYTADWFKDIEGLAMVDESADQFALKKPSEEVISRISNACTFTKKNSRLRNISTVSGVAALCIIGIAVYFLLQASTARKEKLELDKQIELANDTITNARAEIAGYTQTLKDRQKEIDRKDSELVFKQENLLVAQQNIDRLGLESRSAALTAKGAKMADHKPNEAIEYLKQAYQLHNDPEILAVALSMSDKALCIRELKLGKEIQDIDLNRAQTHAAVLTYDMLYVIELGSFGQTAVALPHYTLGGRNHVKFLDDGNILVNDAHVNLYNVNERKMVQLDSMEETDCEMSANSHYYINIGSGKAYYMPIQNGNPVLLNHKLNQHSIEAVTISPTGKYFVVDGSEHTLLCDASANILDTLRVRGSVSFSPDETFLVGASNKELSVYSFKHQKEAYKGVGWMLPSNEVCFSPKYPNHFVVVNDGKQTLWRVNRTENHVTFEEPFINDVSDLASFAADGRIERSLLYVQDNLSKQELTIRDFDGTVNDFVKFDNGTKLIAGDQFGVLKLFDLRILSTYELGFKKEFVNFVMHHNRLYVVCPDSVAVIDPRRKIQTGKVKLQVKCNEIVCSTDDDFFYRGTNNELMVFHMKTMTVGQVHKQIKAFLKYNNRHHTLQYRAADGYVYQYHVKTGKNERLMRSENKMAVSSNGKLIATFVNNYNTDIPEGSRVLMSIAPGNCIVTLYDALSKKQLKQMSIGKALVRFMDFDSLNRLVVGIEKMYDTRFYAIDSSGKVEDLHVGSNYTIRDIDFGYVEERSLYGGKDLMGGLFSMIFSPVNEYISLKEKAVLIKDKKALNKCWFWDVNHNKVTPIVLPSLIEIKSFHITSDCQNVLLSTGRSMYLHNVATGTTQKLRDFYKEVDCVILSPNNRFFLTHDEIDFCNLYAIDGTLIRSFKGAPGNFANSDQAVIVKTKDSFAFWPLDPAAILYK